MTPRGVLPGGGRAGACVRGWVRTAGSGGQVSVRGKGLMARAPARNLERSKPAVTAGVPREARQHGGREGAVGAPSSGLEVPSLTQPVRLSAVSVVLSSRSH